MTQYTLSPKNKKSVVDKQIYTKGGKTIEYADIYRFGTVSFSSENNPDFDPATFDLNNPHGFDVGQLDLDDHDYTDGVGNDIDFSSNMTEKEKDAVMKILDEQGGYELGEILTKKGWSDDYETVFYGPLELEADDDSLNEDALARILTLAKLK